MEKIPVGKMCSATFFLMPIWVNSDCSPEVEESDDLNELHD